VLYRHFGKVNLGNSHRRWPRGPMRTSAAKSTAGIAGSNLAEGIDVRTLGLVCVAQVRRGNPSSSGVLPTVGDHVCHQIQ
jgi:hypothetical protein